jgi:hypothetical protein
MAVVMDGKKGEVIGEIGQMRVVPFRRQVRFGDPAWVQSGAAMYCMVQIGEAL